MKRPLRIRPILVGAIVAGLTLGAVALVLMRRLRTPPRGPSVERVLLWQRIAGLTALVANAQQGPLFPLTGKQVLVTIDQQVVQSLLRGLVPADYVIARRFRIRIAKASVAFEDGFALVRLDGRASLVGAEDQVFADVAALGDLKIVPPRPDSEALQARINLVAVEVTRLDLVMRAQKAEKLVQELGRQKLEEYAALASSIQIPVRQRYEFKVPGVGAPEVVRIEEARVPLELAVQRVTAFDGKLWVSMTASTGTAPSPDESAPTQASPQTDSGIQTAQAGLPPDLEKRHEDLHVRLQDILARDDSVRRSLAVKGDIVLAVSSELAREVIRDVGRSYLDQVALRFHDLDVTTQGSMRRDTFVGRVKVGDWTLDLRMHELSGLLRAGAPRVELIKEDQVTLTFPVRIEKGTGVATLGFAWDSRGLTNLVCQDFKIEEQNLRGVALQDDFPVSGHFEVVAGPGSLEAVPVFPDRFRVGFDLDPQSWTTVRARLEEQDHWDRCGIAMDPDKVQAELQARAHRGVMIKLPSKLFRPITLPSGVTESVAVGNRDLKIAAAQNVLRVTSDVIWYSANVQVQVPPAPSGADGTSEEKAANEEANSRRPLHIGGTAADHAAQRQ